MLRLDLKDLHGPLLSSVEPFGFLAVALGLVFGGPGVAQDHSFVGQHVLNVRLFVLPNAVLQKSLCDSLSFRPLLRLE